MHPVGAAVCVSLLPIERRRLLSLCRESDAETERQLFWKLIAVDNGAPPTPTVFTVSEIRMLCGLASHEGPAALVRALLSWLCTALDFQEVSR